MAPVVGRMHQSHMSNPFAHVNPHNAIPQSSHYQSQSTHLPSTFGGQLPFGSSALNGGITPFNPGSAYGSGAFGGGGASSFNGSALSGQGHGLGSAAAQAGFARGAAMQEHSQHIDAQGLAMKSGPSARIREVWKYNLESEFELLRQLIQKYTYVSMDAEFPGIVARPIGNFAGSKAEYHYQTLRCNVDILKPIQVGITLWTRDGDLLDAHDSSLLTRSSNKTRGFANDLFDQNFPCTWVFNFEFNLEEDMYAESSIELLRQSGVEFQRHTEAGISQQAFGSLLTTSGLAFNPEVNWLSFHSGYDFGYLIKLLSNDALPTEQSDFFDLVDTFFPKLWDIKYLLRHAQRERSQQQLSPEGSRIVDALGSKSGLSDLADELNCQRVGQAHTAGSDAWLTGAVFWSMKARVFAGAVHDDLANNIYGLHGVAQPASQLSREEFFAAQGNTAATAATNGAPGSANFTPNIPSTPTTQHAGLNAQTPGYSGGHGGLGAGFGNFQYGKN